VKKKKKAKKKKQREKQKGILLYKKSDECDDRQTHTHQQKMIFLCGGETTPTQVKVCGAPATAPQLHKEGGTGEIRERRETRCACEVAMSEQEYAKENAHAAQCATSMDIRKRKQPFLYIFFTYLPSFLPSYLPTYVPTNLFTSLLLLFEPHVVAAHYLPTYLPIYLPMMATIIFLFFFF
jgi:hypothetical protein